MIAWIKETFFPDDEVQQLLEEVEHLRRQLHAHKLAYAEEINWYKLEMRRLQAEMGQIVSKRSSSFDVGRDDFDVESRPC
jgi:hypothetical protein